MYICNCNYLSSVYSFILLKNDLSTSNRTGTVKRGEYHPQGPYLTESIRKQSNMAMKKNMDRKGLKELSQMLAQEALLGRVVRKGHSRKTFK